MLDCGQMAKEKGKSMHIIRIFILLTMLLIINAFSQGATVPAKVTEQATPKIQPTALDAPAQIQGKTNGLIPAKQTGVYSYTKELDGAKARMGVRMKCDSIYGAEIKKRTVDLQKQLMDLMQKEQTTENTKRQNNSNLKKMNETCKQLRIKDSLAYRDTSVNKMKLRKDAQDEKMAAMQKMRAEEAKMYNDPELQKIRQTIVDLRKQIQDTIAVIVKDDSNCLSCYGGK
jgi:hypothetical protein